MPEKDPITPIGLLATLLLAAGFIMLYLLPEEQLNPVARQLTPEPASPFVARQPAAPEPAKPPPETPQPVVELPAVPALSEAELQQLTPEERSRYETLRQSLQQTLQSVQQLEQENTRLQQQIRQGAASDAVLSKEIEQIRSELLPSPDLPE